MSDERLDRVIDDVARQMTAGQPSSDFRARVIAGLDRRPRRAWRSLWIAVPLGTLAAAILVILVARGFSTSAPHRMQRATVDAPKREERVGGQLRDRGPERAALRPNSPTATAPSPAAPTPDTTTVRLPADATYDGPRGTRVAAAGRRQDPSGGAAAEVAALAPPPLEVPPLGVEAIGVAALPTDSIAVTQLDAVAPMSIDPLPTHEARPTGGANDEPVEHRP